MIAFWFARRARQSRLVRTGGWAVSVYRREV